MYISPRQYSTCMRGTSQLNSTLFTKRLVSFKFQESSSSSTIESMKKHFWKLGVVPRFDQHYTC